MVLVKVVGLQAQSADGPCKKKSDERKKKNETGHCCIAVGRSVDREQYETAIEMFPLLYTRCFWLIISFQRKLFD